MVMLEKAQSKNQHPTRQTAARKVHPSLAGRVQGCDSMLILSLSAALAATETAFFNDCFSTERVLDQPQSGKKARVGYRDNVSRLDPPRRVGRLPFQRLI